MFESCRGHHSSLCLGNRVNLTASQTEFPPSRRLRAPSQNIALLFEMGRLQQGLSAMLGFFSILVLYVPKRRMHSFLSSAAIKSSITTASFLCAGTLCGNGVHFPAELAAVDQHLKHQIEVVRSEEHTSELQSRQYLVC